MTRSERLLCAGYVLLLLLPFLFSLFLIARYSVEVFMEDQFSLVPLLQAAGEGRFLLAGHLSEGGMHPLLLSRLLISSLAILGVWNVRINLLVGNLLTFATGMMLVWLLRRTHASCGEWMRRLLAVLIMAALFIDTQYVHQHLMLGLLITNALLVGGVAVLMRTDRPRMRIAAGALLATGASLSFGNGLLAWPALLPLALRQGSTSRARIMASIAWAVFAVPVIVGLRLGETGGDVLVLALADDGAAPATIFSFFLAVLGSPLFPFSRPQATAAGLVACVLLCMGCVELFRRPRRSRVDLAPWLCLIAYAVSSALLASMVRAGAYVGMSVPVRYLSITVLAWIALLAMAWLQQSRKVALLAAGAAVVFCTISAAAFVPLWPQWFANLQEGRACLIAYQTASDSCLRHLAQDPARARAAAPALAALGYLAPAKTATIATSQYPIANTSTNGPHSSSRAACRYVLGILATPCLFCARGKPHAPSLPRNRGSRPPRL